jgi:hypothetical protein
MSDVLSLKEKRIIGQCLLVRDRLLAFDYHSQEMPKAQLIKVCKEIINGMFDILDMVEEQEHS